MRVLCCIKRVVDPYVAVRVRSDGSAVETDNVKMATNPFCENALEQALAWKGAGVADEVVAVSLGPSDVTDNLRMALALGADRAIHVACEGLVRPLQVAGVVAAVAKCENADVVWLGKQSIDGDNNQTGQMAAALLGWPQALFLSRAEVSDGKIVAESEVDNGLACLELEPPCVLTADLRLNEPRYPALPAILKAKSKPLETLSCGDLGVDMEDALETVGVAPPKTRTGGRMVSDAAELGGLLKTEISALG